MKLQFHKIYRSREGDIQLLDATIDRLGLRNDSQLSAALGTTRPTISKIRTGKKRLTDVVVVAIMETAQYSLDEVKVILDPSSKSMS